MAAARASSTSARPAPAPGPVAAAAADRGRLGRWCGGRGGAERRHVPLGQQGQVGPGGRERIQRRVRHGIVEAAGREGTSQRVASRPGETYTGLSVTERSDTLGRLFNAS